MSMKNTKESKCNCTSHRLAQCASLWVFCLIGKISPKKEKEKEKSLKFLKVMWFLSMFQSPEVAKKNSKNLPNLCFIDSVQSDWLNLLWMIATFTRSSNEWLFLLLHQKISEDNITLYAKDWLPFSCFLFFHVMNKIMFGFLFYLLFFSYFVFLFKIIICSKVELMSL